MSGLCGWFAAGDGASTNAEAIALMARAISRFGGEEARCTGTAFGAVALAAPASAAHVFRGEHELVAIWGYPRMTRQDRPNKEPGSDLAQLLAEAYARKGCQFLASLTGSFALAILDGRRGRALLAVDRMATKPLCYTTAQGKLVFGTTLDALSAFPGTDNTLRPQAVYEYLHFHMVPAPQTIYAHHERLLPGTFLEWETGKAKIAHYWSLQFKEDKRRPFAELKKEFISLVRQSVAECVDAGNTGAFLSGGTDSSTVTGMLREVTGQAPRTYSIGFEANGYDETHYARIAANHFGARHHEYYVTPDDVVRAIPLIAAVHDQPFGNSSAVPAFYCARMAREDGIRTLLGGDGGDELFGGNARYATQYLYSLYGDLPGTLRKLFIEPALSLFPRAGIFGKLQRYMAHASLPMPARYDHYNLLDRLGPETVLTPEFLSQVNPDAPALQMKTSYYSSNAETLINRMLALDLKYTLADNDLPKVASSCELAAVEARFPLLDDELVEFSAALAPEHKLRGRQLRYFFKKALNGFLPPEVLSKSKHGFGLPFGVWLGTHSALRKVAQDRLATLKDRRIVQPSFIDELMSVHVQAHPQYYGTMVWLLVMLEEWLDTHRVSLH